MSRSLILRNSLRTLASNESAATRQNNWLTPSPVLADTAQYSAPNVRATVTARFSIISYT